MDSSGYQAFEDTCKRFTQRQLRSLGCQQDKESPYAGPSDSTLFRVLARLDAAHFESVVGAWLLEQEVSVLERLALDGKVLRGSGRSDGKPLQRLSASDHCTRSHSLREMFSVLTGGRFRVRYSATNAAALIADIAQQVTFVDLTPEETLRGLAEASRQRVIGGRVHDLMHAMAAKRAGADKLLTLNSSDFSGLERGFEIGAP